jgi:hypothetical protein
MINQDCLFEIMLHLNKNDILKLKYIFPRNIFNTSMNYHMKLHPYMWIKYIYFQIQDCDGIESKMIIDKTEYNDHINKRRKGVSEYVGIPITCELEKHYGINKIDQSLDNDGFYSYVPLQYNNNYRVYVFNYKIIKQIYKTELEKELVFMGEYDTLQTAEKTATLKADHVIIISMSFLKFI